MATTGILSAHPLLLLLRELDHRGIDPAPALESSGLTVDRLHRLDIPVPAVQGLRLVRHLIDLAADPDLGLAAGRHARPDDLGLAGLALRSSRDVTTGLAIFSQLQLSSAPYFSGGIGFSPDGLAVHYDPELGRRTPRALHDLFLTSAYSIARHVLDDFVPAALELALPEPGDRSGYDRLLPVPARFGRQRTRIVIPAATLQGVLPHHDELVHRMIASHVLDQQPDSRPADLVGEVRALLLASPDTGLPSITEVAQRLATSARHLRRQLSGRAPATWRCSTRPSASWSCSTWPSTRRPPGRSSRHGWATPSHPRSTGRSNAGPG